MYFQPRNAFENGVCKMAAIYLGLNKWAIMCGGTVTVRATWSADALAPCVTRTLAAMLLTCQSQWWDWWNQLQWLHPIWPPPKRPDQDITFYVVSRISTELIFAYANFFRNNVYKTHRLVCECCRDISAWNSRVMKPTLGCSCVGWSQLSMDEANSTFAMSFKA